MLEFFELEEKNGYVSLYENHITVNKSLMEYLKEAYRVRIAIDKQNDEMYIYPISKDYALSGELKESSLLQISVSKTYGFREKLNKDTGKVEKVPMSAFAENTIVMRPAGAVGQMQWSKVSNIFSTPDVPMYFTDGGAIAVQEDTKARAHGKKFSAESLCVPVPTAIERVLYLNTAEAAK